MKTKILLLIILFCLTMTSHGQIQKGTGIIGGGISGEYYNDNDTENNSGYSYQNSSFDISFSYGYYSSDHLAFGIDVGSDFSNFKNSSSTLSNYENKTQSSLYYLSPYMRMSKHISDKMFFFGKLGIKGGIGPIKNTHTDPVNTLDYAVSSNQVELSADVTGGINYFLNNHFAFKIGYGDLSYSSSRTEQESATGAKADDKSVITENKFGLNLGLSSVSLGVEYFIHTAK